MHYVNHGIRHYDAGHFVRQERLQEGDLVTSGEEIGQGSYLDSCSHGPQEGDFLHHREPLLPGGSCMFTNFYFDGNLRSQWISVPESELHYWIQP